jgi:hypothetical protein
LYIEQIRLVVFENGFNRPFAKGSMSPSRKFSRITAFCENRREVSNLATDQGQTFDDIAGGKYPNCFFSQLQADQNGCFSRSFLWARSKLRRMTTYLKSLLHFPDNDQGHVGSVQSLSGWNLEFTQKPDCKKGPELVRSFRVLKNRSLFRAGSCREPR